MGRLFRCIVFALVLANTPAIAPVRAAEPVDLLLVLAADVSRSVDSQKFQLQREGYAAAMANSRVMDALVFCFSNGRASAARRSSSTG